eukprot:7825467-Pyramimonas_sp.AAC.1
MECNACENRNSETIKSYGLHITTRPGDPQNSRTSLGRGTSTVQWAPLQLLLHGTFLYHDACLARNDVVSVSESDCGLKTQASRIPSESRFGYPAAPAPRST